MKISIVGLRVQQSFGKLLVHILPIPSSSAILLLYNRRLLRRCALKGNLS